MLTGRRVHILGPKKEGRVRRLWSRKDKKNSMIGINVSNWESICRG